MTSLFSGGPRSKADRLAIEVGRQIHLAVVDEGRREGVWAYLCDDGNGHAWFEKCEKAEVRDGVIVKKPGLPYRRFSPELAARIRQHKEELRIYVEWRRAQRETKAPAGGVANVRMRREVAAARLAAVVDRQLANKSANISTSTPSPGVGSENGR